MIPKPDLKFFLGVLLLSVILFSNAYDCCSGGGEENETTEAPAAGTTVAIGMIKAFQVFWVSNLDKSRSISILLIA